MRSDRSRRFEGRCPLRAQLLARGARSFWAGLAAATLGLLASPLHAAPEALRPPPVEAPAAATRLTVVVLAYAAIWIVAFGFILLSLLRQRRLEQRLERLASQLARAAAAAEPRAGSDDPAAS